MDKKDIDAIYNLMQNVVDKLSSLSNKIELESQKANKPEIQNILKKQETTIGYLVHISDSLEGADKTKKETVNNHNEYILFGKESAMNNRLLFTLASLIIIAWLGFKFLVPVIIEQDKIKLENKNYRIMHDYLYLKDIRGEDANQSIDGLMKQIQTQDTIFLNEFRTMLTEHKTIQRRMQLENELKQLK